jgi:hypothetical protein
VQVHHKRLKLKVRHQWQKQPIFEKKKMLLIVPIIT